MMRGKNDWYIWGEWPGIPWFHSCYTAGMALELKRRAGFGLSKLVAEYREGAQRFYLLESEWREAGAQYFAAVLANPRKLEHDLRAIESAADALFGLNKRLLRVQPARLSMRALASWYARFHDLQHELWCAGMVPNLLELNNSYLSSYIRRYIETPHGPLAPQDWQTLISPTRLSAAQEEERAFLTTVVRAQRDHALPAALRRCKDDLSGAQDAIRRFPAIFRALRAHHKKFSWVQFGWTGPATPYEYYLDLFVRFVRQKYTAKKLRAVRANDLRLPRMQRLLEQRLIADAKHQRLLSLLRGVLFAKAYRMDALYQGYAAMEPFLKEIGKRLSLSLNQVYMAYAPQMLAMLKAGHADADRINAAMQHSAFIKEGNRVRFYVGAEARKKVAPILTVLPKPKKVRELKGEIGYPGKVRGRVTIVDTRKDMSKLKAGDILVSHATDPSLLPAMKIAAAFVTDLGGLTAHAAIVAREMKKPCLVGTRIATQIFKDGDRIEVDAERGVVRKI